MVIAEPVRSEQARRGESLSRRRHALPRLDQVELLGLRADQLRVAVRNSLVTFPSQVPVFERHDRPDLQRRIVQLYFLLGWNCESIAARYGMLRQRIGQVLNTWKRRAIETGYIQYIPPAESCDLQGRVVRIVFSTVTCKPSTHGPAGARRCGSGSAWSSHPPPLMAPIKESYGIEA